MPNKFVGHGPYHYAKGGEVRRELKFMEDKGAPKSMIAAEKKEHGLPAGKKFAVGGGVTEGENKGIDDPTRERAMAAVRARMAAAAAADEGAVASPVREAPPAQVRKLPAIRRPARKAVDPTAGEAREGPAAQLAADRMGTPGPGYRSEGRPMAPQNQQEAERDLAILAAQNKALQAARAPKASYSNEGRGRGADRSYGRDDTDVPVGMAAGGSIDGCAQRGKTRAKRG